MRRSSRRSRPTACWSTKRARGGSRYATFWVWPSPTNPTLRKTAAPNSSAASRRIARSANSGLLPALRTVEQFLVGEHQRDHRLDHRHAADADAGVVAALGRNFGRVPFARDRLNWGQDR